MSLDASVLDRPRPGWLRGPWPLAPLVSFVIMFPATLVVTFRSELLTPVQPCLLFCWRVPQTFLPGFVSSTSVVYEVDPTVVVGYSLALAGACGITLLLFQRMLHLDDFHAPSRRDYLVAITTAAVVGAVAGHVALVAMQRDAAVIGLVPTVPRAFVVLVLIHWVSGRLTYGYALEAARANAALAERTQQRWLIVQSDERVRREIADYLHDNVQAELLVAALRLRALGPTLDPSGRTELDEVVTEIERIRQVGVRGAGQRLSPDTAGLGLYATTSYLASMWAPAMAVTLDFSAEAQQRLVAPFVSADVPTALYRVIEQALLNSAAHGRARNVAVRVTVDDDAAQLNVIDDGDGVPDDAATATDALRGTGTAVCDAWMDVVGGTWQRTALSRGVQVSARVPLGSPAGS